jgi:hypothetical protein
MSVNRRRKSFSLVCSDFVVCSKGFTGKPLTDKQGEKEYEGLISRIALFEPGIFIQKFSVAFSDCRRKELSVSFIVES